MKVSGIKVEGLLKESSPLPCSTKRAVPFLGAIGLKPEGVPYP